VYQGGEQQQEELDIDLDDLQDFMDEY